ncbi:gasdermin-B isoform X2 [Hippopotamus amphibius kiboko]|uniref:gasdermin-B isoform X2 n=1 Tax=Hippopotamus amphibius kiboko TaxID=575201 RepID=UPI002596552B|nr:gasdermin-B isoform X2 [Hippopotamus amphibius kiboko]
MPAVFEEVARAVVYQMDPAGDMIAVRSLMDADRFHCFYLVKKSRHFFGYQYDKTDLTLEDILEMEEGEVLFDKLVPGPQDQEDKTQVMDCVDAKGNLAVKLPKEEKTEGGITIYEHQEHGIELSKTRILQKFLDSLDNKKLKTTLPPSFRSIQAMREDLYLVTETLKTIKKETLESEQQYTFWNWIACFGLHCEHKVSEVRRSGELQVEGPAGPLINSLFNAAGILIEERAEAIWDFLDALMELSEERKLVAEALDKGILPLLKDKVESTLEQNWGEQPCDVGCDPEARTLCALYVVVSVLLQLGEKPTSVSS